MSQYIHRRFNPATILIISLQILLLTNSSCQRAILVSSISELRNEISALPEGGTILLSDGDYTEEAVLQSMKSSADHPIVIRAENQGKAVIQSGIRIEGSHISLFGCRFEGQGSVVIEGKDCRLSRCTFNDSKARKWVRVLPGSSGIEIDHNLFENKTINLTEKSCQLMQIIVENTNEKHHIHHNLFRDIPEGEGNGYETLQLITRGNPFDPPPGKCNTIIEKNLFIRCNGEPEIISVKSNGNLIIGNTFRACRGSVVFRHGDENTAVQNCFFGDGESGSGGIRLQGTDQVVANNYFHGLGGFGIAMMDGTPDDLYIRVERAKILHNTFYHCNNNFMIGLNHSRHPNGTPPKDCTIEGNIFVHDTGKPVLVFIQNDLPENWRWKDNITWKGEIELKDPGILMADPRLELQADNLAYPTVNTPSTASGSGMHAQLSFDLLGQERGKTRTSGAIQFPVQQVGQPVMTEQLTGPDAE